MISIHLKVLHADWLLWTYTEHSCILKLCPTPSHLKYVNEDILLWLLGAANIFQDDGVVDALGVRLVQVICVWLVPLLEGEEDLVLVCTHYLDILGAEMEGWREKEKWWSKRDSIFRISGVGNERVTVEARGEKTDETGEREMNYENAKKIRELRKIIKEETYEGKNRKNRLDTEK